MIPRLPALKPKAVLKALQRAGFYIHHTTGSHKVLKHPGRPNLRVTVSLHNKDLKRRTMESIIDQSGMTRDQFIALL